MNSKWIWPCGGAAMTAMLYLGSRWLPATWWLVPWVLSLVFIGLPHGALDHEVALRLWKPQPPPRWALPAILIGYLALAATVMVGWFLFPPTIFLFFILLTWAHWGLGDLWWSWQRDPAYFTSEFHRIIFACWRGALPLLLPLVVAPHLYRQVAESICLLFAHTAPQFGWIESLPLREGVLAGVLLFGFIDLCCANRDSGTCLLGASEGLVLAVAFLVLPPVVAIGFYFVFWHGLRHVLRLLKVQQLTFSEFALHSAPATIVALILLVILACVLIEPGRHPEFLALYLALIATLTVPHTVVVTWMDRRIHLY